MRRLTLMLLGMLLGALTFTGGNSPASSGILDLFDDPISRYGDCSYVPCRDNNLIYKRRYVDAPYYRFKLRKAPVQYGFKRVKVRVLPPQIAVSGGAEINWLNKRAHVVAGTSRYRVVSPARYEWVTKRVFRHPPRYRVVRVGPTHALTTDKIVVVDPACQPAPPGARCRY